MYCAEVVAVLALFAASPALAGGAYYVDPNGSDSNIGSLDSPFGTFDHAISVALPGDTIHVRGGTYMLDHRLLIDKAGTPEGPIRLWAMPGETPILDFSSNPLAPPQPRDGDVGAVNEAVGLTSSRDVLSAVGSTGLPSEIIVTLGYSGWDAGQLESELAQNSWLTVPAKASILFELPPEERLPAAMQRLGVSFTQLSDVAGHA